MCCKKCLFVFLAGAAAWEAVGHLYLLFTHQTVHVFGKVLSQNLNYGIIGGSFILAALLLYLARSERCMCSM